MTSSTLSIYCPNTRRMRKISPLQQGIANWKLTEHLHNFPRRLALKPRVDINLLLHGPRRLQPQPDQDVQNGD